jgi:hypothetical protein
MKKLITALLVLLLTAAGSAETRRLAIDMPLRYGDSLWLNNWFIVKMGDLDGDREIEFVFANQEWEMVAVDDIGVCTTAATAEARKLWSNVNPAGGDKVIDNPYLTGRRVWKGWHAQSFAVWDMDNDGKCEVVATWRLPWNGVPSPLSNGDSAVVIAIFNGETGALIAHTNQALGVTGGSADAYGAYNVGIADFRGNSRPADVYLSMDGGSTVYAYCWVPGEDTLTQLWKYNGWTPGFHGGHQATAFDVDGDGKDEFIKNGVIDHDGTSLYSIATLYDGTRLDSHADNAYACDVVPANPGTEVFLVPCNPGAEAHVITDPVTGAILVDPADSSWYAAQYAGAPFNGTLHLEIGALGNFRKDVAGLEFFCTPKLNTCNLLTDYRGEFLALNGLGADHWCLNTTIDWDGDRSQDEALFNSMNGVQVYGFKDTVYSFVDYGYVPCLMADKLAGGATWPTQYGFAHPMDLLGDYREEVVFNTHDSLIIYQNLDPNPYGPHPSPRLSEKYMVRFSQVSFGGCNYYPYNEYDEGSTAGENRAPAAGEGAAGLAVSPNPFNPAVKIAVIGQRIADSNIGIAIYDMKGRMIQKLSATSYQLSAGINWNASRLASGTYIVRIQTGKKCFQRAITLLK